MNKRALDISNLASSQAALAHDYCGLWAMEASRFQALFNRVQRMDLAAHIERHAKPHDAEDEPADRASRVTKPTLIEPSSGGKQVAVVELRGSLMKKASSLDESTSTVRARQQIRDAANDAGVGGILLMVDSPGGTVSGTADLAADVAAAAEQKPVFAFAEDVAASAAYWIASQATRIDANDPTAVVGSIGTLLGLYDMSELAENEGVEALVFSTGPLKGAGFPGAKVTEAQRSYFQGIVDQTQKSFRAAVAAGRGMSTDDVRDLETGGVFMAETAQTNGLIDGIRSYDQVVLDLLERANGATNDETSVKTDPTNTLPKGNAMPTDEQATDQTPAPAAEDNSNEARPVTDAAKDQVNTDATDQTSGGDQASDQSQASQEKQPDGQAFIDAFGEQGAVWFAQGYSFEQARVKYTEQLEAENKQLKQKLNQIDRGADEPVAFEPEEQADRPDAQNHKHSHLPPAARAIAGAVRVGSRR